MKGHFLAVFFLLLIGGLAISKSVPLFPQQSATLGSNSYSARTDFAVLQVPNPVPNMGGATGTGNSALDPDFNTHIYRLTDINTVPQARYAAQQNWQMSCGGWGAWRVANADSTKIFVCHTGGRAFVLSFDPSTGKPGPARTLPSGIAGYPEWSKTQKNVAFGFAPSRDPQVVRVDFSGSSAKVSPVVNFAKVPNCAEEYSGKTAWRELSFAWDDATFAVAVGTGAQESAHTIYVWNAKNGCQTYDTEAATVNGAPISGATDHFMIHSIKISGSGKVLVITPVAGDYFRHFWHVGTPVVDISHTDVNEGHFDVGYDAIVNTGGKTSGDKWCKLGMSVHLLTDLSSVKQVLTPQQCGNSFTEGDDHVSWNNDDSADSQPFATSTVIGPHAPIRAPWQNEIVLFTQDGAVHREAHTFNSAASKIFACQNAIGSISEDGKWFFFSSDWEGTLGKDSSGNQRCDDFAVRLH